MVVGEIAGEDMLFDFGRGGGCMGVTLEMISGLLRFLFIAVASMNSEGSPSSSMTPGCVNMFVGERLSGDSSLTTDDPDVITGRVWLRLRFDSSPRPVFSDGAKGFCEEKIIVDSLVALARVGVAMGVPS